MTKSRFIWEQIMEGPDIFRISESGSRANSYLILSGEECLVIDPRFGEMLSSILRLARGLGAHARSMRVFVTHDRGRALVRMMKMLPEGTVLYAPGNPVFYPEKQESEPDAFQERKQAEQDRKQTEQEREFLIWTIVEDCDLIRVGSHSFRVIRTEGTRAEQAGLWFPEAGIFFSGNAVGCDYVPEVPDWSEEPGSMELQISLLRRLSGMPVQCILPAYGRIAGADNIIPGENRAISPECVDVLNRLLEQYCLRILKVYQMIPDRGSITEQELIVKRSTGRMRSAFETSGFSEGPAGSTGEAARGPAGAAAGLREAARGPAGAAAGLREAARGPAGAAAGSREAAREQSWTGGFRKSAGRLLQHDCLESCLRYLQNGGFIEVKETDGGRVYERGRVRLTDWRVR